MKLVLANNQTEKFRDFHSQIQQDEKLYDYSSYTDLLFCFDATAEHPASFLNLATNRHSYDYEGVYINGYINTPDIAFAVAATLESDNIPYTNQELSSAPSLSKLSAHAKLAKHKISAPKTYGGFKSAILSGLENINLSYPVVLKRVDADRGIDNFKLKSIDEVRETLTSQDDATIWVIQDFIANDGFYLVSYYFGEPKFGIFRTLEKRPDGNERMAHMYKPKGGANATLLEVADIPKSVLDTSEQAVTIMNRQFASVDSIYDKSTDTTYVLEVNYNPQLVTIETFKDIRQSCFIEAMRKLGAKNDEGNWR